MQQRHSNRTVARCTAIIPRTLCMPSCSSVALQGMLKSALLVFATTLQIFHFIQYYSHLAQMHSTNAQDPLYALCSSAALQAKFQPALLVAAVTLVNFWTSYSSSKHCPDCMRAHRCTASDKQGCSSLPCRVPCSTELAQAFAQCGCA